MIAPYKKSVMNLLKICKLILSLEKVYKNSLIKPHETRLGGALGISGSGNYWEISDDVLNRIEGGSYLENEMRHNEFLKDAAPVDDGTILS